MDVILANANGEEERVVNCEYDFSIGGEGTFELSIPYADWTGDITFGKRVYIPGTEYGGIVKAIEGDTSKETVFVRGYTWRGYWSKKLFKGSLNGDLAVILETLIGAYSGIFRVSGLTGITASAMISDYVTIEEAARIVLGQFGLRLALKYVQAAESGYCLVSAVPARNTDDEISQDGYLNFASEDYRMGVNHLIAYNGTDIVHVYADINGNVSTVQTLFGTDEFTAAYYDDDDDVTRLRENAMSQLEEMSNYKQLRATYRDTDRIDLEVGDIVGGIDYVTGLKIQKPITSKIVTLRDGNLSIQYGVKEEQT